MFWNIVLGVGAFLLNMVLAPKPQSVKPASLSDFGIPVAEEGLEIPVAFGSVWCKSPNTVWYGDLTLQAISGPRRYVLFGPKSTIGYKYGIGLHMILCHSSQDKIHEIWAEKKLFPKAPSTDPFEGTGVLVIDQMDIYGGDEAGGGVFGFVHVLSGGGGQGVDAYLEAQLGVGADTPAFRGVVSLVWEHLYIGTSPYLRPWEIYLQRIHKTATGAEQWYDEKAAVPDTAQSNTTEPGVELIAGVATFNDPLKVDANSGFAVRVAEIGIESGPLVTWTLPAGTEHSYLPASLGVGASRFSSTSHITAFGEVIVQYGGNIWGGLDTFLQFRSAADPATQTQAQINLTSTWIAEGVAYGNRNFGFCICERDDYMLLRFLPTFWAQPYLLLHRSGGEWEIQAVREDLTTGPTSMSMGSTYVYAWISAFTFKRITYLSGSTTTVDLTSLGITGIYIAHAYCEGTGEVVVVCTTGIFVFNSTLTALVRSKTDYAYGLYTADTRRMFVSTTNFIVNVTAFAVNRIWEINVSSLAIVRDTNVLATSFVNKTQVPEFLKYDSTSDGVIVGKHSLMPLSFWPYSAPDARNMNPAHIIRECLTDRTWGMGYAAIDIDDDTFTAAADVLFDECFGLSLLWQREQPLEEFISMILQHIDAYLYLRRDTGKFTLKLVRFDYVVADLPIFYEKDVDAWEQVERRQPPEAINTVTVKWTDKQNRGKDAATSYDNIAQIQQIGARVPVTRFYPGITYGPLAASVARRDQRSLGIGLINGRLRGHRTFDRLYPGDPFRLVSETHKLEGETMRVVEMDFGDGRANTIGVKFIQDVFRMNLEEIIDTSDSDWEDPGAAAPEPVAPRLTWEMPYYELNQLVGPSDLASMLTTDPDAGVIEVAGAQPSGLSLQADIWVDGADSGELLSLWAPAGVLSAALGGDPVADVTFVLLSAVDTDNIEVGMLAALVDASDPTDPTLIESVRITDFDAETLTVTVDRAMLDSAPQQHASGTWFVVFNDFTGTDAEVRTAADTPSVELLTRTMSGVLSNGDAPNDEVTLDSRAARPLRPANVTVAGAYSGPVDATALSDIPVDCVERNRLTETGTPLAWTDATVTPEAGQTIVIEVLDPGGSVLATYDTLTIADMPFDVPVGDFSGESSGFIRVGAKRDGYREWQGTTIEVLVSIEILSLGAEGLTLGGQNLALGG